MAEHLRGMRTDTCVICGRTGPGIRIGNQLICDSCEKKMVRTDVSDWKYRYYVEKLSAIRLAAREEARQSK